MGDFPVPFNILDRASHVKKLLENYGLKEDFKVLVGENHEPLMIDFDLIGHLLISGWVQSGKELILNAIVQSLMLLYRPDQARLIIYDTQADLSQYDESNPYLLTNIIHEFDKTVSALKWTFSELENRYKELRQKGCRFLYEYNRTSKEKKPRIVFIIKTVDQLIDAIPKDSKFLIQQLIDRGRNVGIHLVIVTNKISKINTPPELLSQLPNRIICQTTSEEDSIIAGAPGAHILDYNQFYLLLYQEKPVRFQKTDINKFDIKNIVQYFKKITPTIKYTEDVTPVSSYDSGDKDPLYSQAVKIVSEFDHASASLIQRRLTIGYARAARLLDQMEEEGIVGPAIGSRPREVLKK